MRRLLRDNHEDPRSQLRLMRLRGRAAPVAARRRGRRAASTRPATTAARSGWSTGLQLGFALNQPLSTYALAVFDMLDPEAPTYALDVVSVVEATLEDPRPVLGAQEHKARGEAVGEMKADGIEYDERMELLEEVVLAQAAPGAARAHLRGLPAQPPVGGRGRAVARSRSCATCTSAR